MELLPDWRIAMQALRNLTNAAVLAVWALLGIAFTLRLVFRPGASVGALASAGGWWLWFAALAVVATWLVGKLESALGALAVHAGLVLVLGLLPAFGPFAYVRFGFDALHFV
jgi:hypothetical protein